MLLQSEAGKQYVKSYYVHATEMVALLISHSEIREKLMAALNVIKPSIENMMQGYPLAINKAQMRTIEDLTKEVKKVASRSLKKTVCQFEKDIKNKNLSKEFSLAMSK